MKEMYLLTSEHALEGQKLLGNFFKVKSSQVHLFPCPSSQPRYLNTFGNSRMNSTPIILTPHIPPVHSAVDLSYPNCPTYSAGAPPNPYLTCLTLQAALTTVVNISFKVSLALRRREIITHMFFSYSLCNKLEQTFNLTASPTHQQNPLMGQHKVRAQ